jgi:hypothetical protein
MLTYAGVSVERDTESTLHRFLLRSQELKALKDPSGKGGDTKPALELECQSALVLQQVLSLVALLVALLVQKYKYGRHFSAAVAARSETSAPAALFCAPPPHQFTCFTGTKVQILTPLLCSGCKL